MAWRLLHKLVEEAPRLAVTVASREARRAPPPANGPLLTSPYPFGAQDLPEFLVLREAAAAPRKVGSCRVAPAFSLVEVTPPPYSSQLRVTSP